MHLEKYPYAVSASSLEYTFESTGPKGVIKKVVRYNPEQLGEFAFLNLVFGNMNGPLGDIDTLSVSANGDRDKLLATVAATVIDVTRKYPESMVYAKGSTASRTRLYQMGIFLHHEFIAPLFDIYAFKDGSWHQVKKT